MFDLIKKDILVTIKSDKLLLVSYIATLYIFYTILNPFAYYSANVFFSYLVLTRTFYYDYENNSNRFMMSMPINKENIVYSKYILSVGLIISTTILNNLVAELMSGKYFRGTVLNDVLISLIMYLLLVAIVLPTFFIFKNKNISKFIGIVVAVILVLTVGVYLALLLDFRLNPENVVHTIKFLGYFVIEVNLFSIGVGALIIFLLSMFLSLKIVKHQKGGKRYEKVC